MATRTQICDALLQALKGLSASGAHIYSGMQNAVGVVPSHNGMLSHDSLLSPNAVPSFLWSGHQIEAASLPCVLVKMGAERNEYVSTDQPRAEKRVLELEVKCVAKASAGLQPMLNTIAAGVEASIDLSRYLGGLVFALDLVDSGWSLDGEAEQPHGAWSLQYQATYFTREASVPVAALSPLKDVLASAVPNVGAAHASGYQKL